MTLRLLPRRSSAGDPIVLRLPRPLNVDIADGFLAYRLKSDDADVEPRNLGVTSAADLFLKAWQAAGQAPVQATRAYGFRRAAADAAMILTPKKRLPQSKSSYLWHVYGAYATVSAETHIAALDEHLVLVELDVPAALVVTDIAASEPTTPAGAAFRSTSGNAW